MIYKEIILKINKLKELCNIFFIFAITLVSIDLSDLIMSIDATWLTDEQIIGKLGGVFFIAVTWFYFHMTTFYKWITVHTFNFFLFISFIYFWYIPINNYLLIQIPFFIILGFLTGYYVLKKMYK